MLFGKICPPALLYLVFSITQIAIDAMKGLYNTALVKCWVTFIFTIILNYLCESGLGIISWIIVFIPFILMTLIVAILLVMFGLDPSTGKIANTNNVDPNQIPKHHRHKKNLSIININTDVIAIDMVVQIENTAIIIIKQNKMIIVRAF